ncbi:hypothetical protein CPHO_10200 [Corynebacterium phocae]|uniref:Uncharacterized protein n=1 Tax=Corynebacterium phocae TaxID=161895 RepID=A0A1L7D4X5_9CORY|nr:hypothetical protein [Corynebacterium phocae]APT93198.1 hypothetical protein CPHO_10200 [Corynebacterium phocae]KAA8721936.1 hypothetical protein F4V58_09675 [Corynebacterium phocae]
MAYQVDFDEFARAFRDRTAQRMVDFERTLAKAQSDVEKAAENARNQMGGEHRTPGTGYGTGQHTLRGQSQGSAHAQAPAYGGMPGQIRSVLRRD